MGQRKDIKDSRMSFHFNVIGERRCMDEFEHIIEQKKKSAENFESKALYGYRIETYDTKRKQIWENIINKVVPVAVDNKDTIVWLMVFALSFFNVIDSEGMGVEGILSGLFVIASAVMILYKAYNFVQLRKYEKKISIVINDTNILKVNDQITHICNRLGIKNQMKMDNILRLLTLMRLWDLYVDSVKGDS